MKRCLIVFILLSYITFCWSQKNSIDRPAVPGTQKSLPIPPKPIDPQIVQDQDDMTWDDYHPIPGKNWADPSIVPERKFRMALVAVDFPDPVWKSTNRTGFQGKCTPVLFRFLAGPIYCESWPDYKWILDGTVAGQIRHYGP
jgi:hypothetical protein